MAVRDIQFDYDGQMTTADRLLINKHTVSN